jgi:hypothetical protein
MVPSVIHALEWLATRDARLGYQEDVAEVALEYEVREQATSERRPAVGSVESLPSAVCDIPRWQQQGGDSTILRGS